MKHRILTAGMALVLAFGVNVALVGCDEKAQTPSDDQGIVTPEKEEEAPNGEEVKPQEGENKPSTDENKPGAEENDKPTSGGEQKPSKDEQKPSEDEQKPSTEGNDKPSSGEEEKPDANEDDQGEKDQDEGIVDEEVLSEGYGSVSYKVKAGEKYSPEAGYTGLQIFGRLNYTFKQKTDWYSVYEGKVDTIMPQDIKTFKQYHDGVLISADISTSAFMNSAKEFCYLPFSDRVMWREASGSSKNYDGFKTPWKEDLAGDMTIEGENGFKEMKGLPAFELSVYVFREDTILEIENVQKNEDGTYTITFHLDPTLREMEDGSLEGATAYYGKQMMFSGGLGKAPTFDEITVSFTFNEEWETLETKISEKYKTSAAFLTDVECTGTSTTTYFYETQPPFEECDDYETYFKKKLQ